MLLSVTAIPPDNTSINVADNNGARLIAATTTAIPPAVTINNDARVLTAFDAAIRPDKTSPDKEDDHADSCEQHPLAHAEEPRDTIDSNLIPPDGNSNNARVIAAAAAVIPPDADMIPFNAICDNDQDITTRLLKVPASDSRSGLED